jgi:hypothetical protein
MNIYAENRISFGDYEFMQTKHLQPARNRLWIPEWSASDLKMRHVLAQRCWAYVSNGGHSRQNIVPDKLVSDRVALTKMVDKFVARKNNWKFVRGAQRAIHAEHLASVKRAHGYLTLQCAVLYRAYRLGQNSVGIAEGLGISPGVVRQFLARANDCARKLGYECQPRHWTAGSKRPHKMRVKEKGRAFQPGPAQPS